MAKHLHVFWYTAKDQLIPINALKKSRNCHIKFFAVDEQVAIVGNGNLDTQSIAHSQEMNVMVCSKQLVADWLEMLRSNQSTGLYGRVDDDGIWRDKETGEGVHAPKKINCFTAIAGLI